MCDNVEDGCLLIREYKTTLATHGHATAILRAARLYRQTDTEASLADAIQFINRFVKPDAERAAMCLGKHHADSASAA